ncbi:MAG: hypothetical protein KJ718_00870 [Nanoarchaeota archaeon]|nr:hypothetical protein [Nanoarchaeota archaeon]MBU1051091.1 hypothetical protein [Nanoarchaeota archaeon]MBU1988262.1 hypothetical protein [Nanoarchaeota archaeon]
MKGCRVGENWMPIPYRWRLISWGSPSSRQTTPNKISKNSNLTIGLQDNLINYPVVRLCDIIITNYRSGGLVDILTLGSGGYTKRIHWRLVQNET